MKIKGIITSINTFDDNGKWDLVVVRVDRLITLVTPRTTNIAQHLLQTDADGKYNSKHIECHINNSNPFLWIDRQYDCVIDNDVVEQLFDNQDDINKKRKILARKGV